MEGRPAGLRTLLLAQLPSLIMSLVSVGLAIVVCVRLVGVWPTVVIWSLVLGLIGLAVNRGLRLRDG